MNAASRQLLFRSDFLQSSAQALTGVAQWITRPPANQRVAGGSVPGQRTCLGCGPSLVGVCKGQITDVSDLSLPLFLPPFPSL